MTLSKFLVLCFLPVVLVNILDSLPQVIHQPSPMAEMPSNPGGPSNDIGSNGGHSGTVQVQVIPTQTGISSTNGSVTSVLSNPGSLLTSTGSNQDLTSNQLSQLGLRFPVDQQQKLLLAAQLQQLSKNQQSVNTSFVLQPTYQVVSSTPSVTSTKGWGCVDGLDSVTLLWFDCVCWPYICDIQLLIT